MSDTGFDLTGSVMRIRQMLVKQLIHSPCATNGTPIPGCVSQITPGHACVFVALTRRVCVCVCVCVYLRVLERVMCGLGTGHPCESAIVCVIAYS